jgi:glycosyltransferase involved in cell wall biosynthesis
MIDSSPKSNRKLNIAMAHDWLVARRGGELVLDAIATHLIQSGHTITNLYTMFDTGKPITPAIDVIPKTTSSLNHLPSPLRRWLLPMYPRAIEQLSNRLAHDHAKQPIDLLISTSSSAIKSLNTPDDIPHVCYCHAPARYLWSQSDQYTTQRGLKSRLRAAGLDRFGDSLRRWDKRTASNVTQFIANSNFIASEIRSTYERDAVVIHPPIRTDYFTPDDTPRNNRLLYVGAIEPYKRVDLAIDAAGLLGLPIDIVGTGSHVPKPTNPDHNAAATFHGFLPDSQVRSLFCSCKALIQPQVEDFGMTAVEAQACGCPVIARRAGGALDSIIETKTGRFFDQPDPTELADAIDRLSQSPCDPEDCRRNALRFSMETFVQKLDAVISSVID